MQTIIKRPYISRYTENENIEYVMQTSLFSEWHSEVRDKNRLFYRFGNMLISIARDIMREQDIIVSKFLYTQLDITQPYYATSITTLTNFDNRLYRKSKDTDDLMSDVHYIARKVKSTDDVMHDKLVELTELVNINHFEYIDINDINKFSTTINTDTTILSDLQEGEYLLSGEIIAATNKGRAFSFGDNNQDIGVYQDAELNNGKIVADKRYCLLDIMTDIDTIVFRSIDDDSDYGIENISSLVVSRTEQNGTYNSLYDIDKDGYISSEDVYFLRNAIGKTTSDVDEKIWKEQYAIFDRKNEGVIREVSVAEGINSLGAVEVNSLIIKNPYPNTTSYVEYDYHDGTYLTYFSFDNKVYGGNYGSKYELKAAELDSRIKDGYVKSDNDLVLGINIDDNLIVVGRKLDYEWALKKVNYPLSNKLMVKGLTKIDNIAFVLLQGENGYMLDNITNIAIVRFDLLREVIEISLDVIYVLGIDLEDNEEVTGICNTGSKDTFRIFTNLNKFHLIKTDAAINVKSEYGDMISQGLEEGLNDTDITSYIKLYNDLDNYAYNIGLKRPYKYVRQ